MCAAQCTVSVCACVCVTKGLSQPLSGGQSYWLAKSWWNNHLFPPPFHSHLDKIYFRHTTLSKSKTLFDEVKWGLTYNPITVAFFFNVFETNKNALGSYVVDTGDPAHLSIYSTDYFSAINTRIQTGTNHCSSAPNIKLLLQLKSHTHCRYMHILLFLHKKGTRLVLA